MADEKILQSENGFVTNSSGYSDGSEERGDARLELLEGELADRFRELAVLTRLLENSTVEGDNSTDPAKTTSSISGQNYIFGVLNQHISEGFGHVIGAVVDELSRFVSGEKAQSITARLLKSSKLFDEEWYLEANPDVQESGMPPLDHYVAFGCREQRPTVSLLALIA